MGRYPERIVALAAEVPGILAELDALDRVVGISAYTTHPPEALDKPKVSGFQHGSVDRILAQEPDLVILTSTVQANLARKLGARGATLIHLHPHRLSDVFQTIRLLGNVVGEAARAEALVHRLSGELEAVRGRGRALARHPRVYFEEWMDPLVAGIGWVSDLVEIAGGYDVFRARATAGRLAQDRVVSLDEWRQAHFDVMLASWCGKPFDPAVVRRRPGAETVPAVRTGRLYAIDGSILECGVRVAEHARKLLALFEHCQ
ncbi:MAG: ABC transporter substrate-binding protein [Firmicutes bacterium]|nr:ABC transporter substrate-binding protein [Bacillota bacterium]